jgi:site-specific recombinase XerC
LDQLNHVSVRLYIDDMRSKPNPRFIATGLSDASIARRLAALSSYCEFIRATVDHTLRNPLKELSNRWKRNKDAKPVDEETLDALLAGITNERDRFIFSLFLSTGLRVSELQKLNRDSISIQETTEPDGSIRTLGVGEVVGKGNKRRQFLVDDGTLMLYATYLCRREDKFEALFLSERKTRMSVRAIQYTLSSWCRKLDLIHINVHRLRHSFATRLANSNINSMVLRDLMGHSSLSTTQRYFKLTDTTLARSYFSAMEFLKN